MPPSHDERREHHKEKRSASLKRSGGVLHLKTNIELGPDTAFVDEAGNLIAVFEETHQGHVKAAKVANKALGRKTGVWKRRVTVRVIGAGATTAVGHNQEALRFFGEQHLYHTPDASVLQLLRLAQLRDALIEQHPTISAAEVADITHSSATNRQMTAMRLKKQGEIFAIEHGGTDRYPAFQFDEKTGAPKPVIATLVSIFDLTKHDPWELFIWLTSPTGLLGGDIPVEKLDSDPPAVLEAAKSERATPYF